MKYFRWKVKSYTLVELLIVVVIMGVMVGIAIPLYEQTVEKSRARTAWTTLKLIRYAKKIYELNVGPIYNISESDTTWGDLKLDNPNVVHAGVGFAFSVEASPFKAEARRTTGDAASETYEIDDTGTIQKNPSGGKLPPVTF